MTLHRKTILVVDDDELVLSLVEADLRQAGFAVLTAANGKDALAIVLREPVDIIVSDVSMPEMDGLEFCERIRRSPEHVDIPFIFLTAHGGAGRKATGPAIRGRRIPRETHQHHRSGRAGRDPLRPHPAKILREHLEGHPPGRRSVRGPSVVRVDTEARRAPLGRSDGEGGTRRCRRRPRECRVERSRGRGCGLSDVHPAGRRVSFPAEGGVVGQRRPAHRLYAHGNGQADR